MPNNQAEKSAEILEIRSEASCFNSTMRKSSSDETTALGHSGQRKSANILGKQLGMRLSAVQFCGKILISGAVLDCFSPW